MPIELTTSLVLCPDGSLRTWSSSYYSHAFNDFSRGCNADCQSNRKENSLPLSLAFSQAHAYNPGHQYPNFQVSGSGKRRSFAFASAGYRILDQKELVYLLAHVVRGNIHTITPEAILQALPDQVEETEPLASGERLFLVWDNTSGKGNWLNHLFNPMIALTKEGT